MFTSNYDGPRSGDYVRYVDDLLRASPLYRSTAHGLMASGRKDFTDAAAAPGGQAASPLARVRERAQAAAQQAQRQAQAAAAKPGAKPAQQGRKARRSRLELEAEQMARRAAQQLGGAKLAPFRTWFRITPGRIIWLVILAILGMTVPGLGAMLLLFTIINAVRNGVRSGNKAP